MSTQAIDIRLHAPTPISVEIVEATPVEIEVTSGPPGGGSGGAVYLHTQSVAASVWTIPHGLGHQPVISVQDSAGTEVFGSVTHPSLNVSIVTFTATFSGTATLV